MVAAGEPLPDDGGNAFVADTDRGAAPDEPGGGPRVDVRWTGDRALHVAADRRARSFREEPAVRGVRITYARF